jgi:hypothetical protein
MTRLHVAAWNGELESVEALLDAGGEALLLAKDSAGGRSCLHTAGAAGHAPVAALLLSRPGAPRLAGLRDRAGRTARAGEEGTVVTLTSPRQQKFVESLTKKAGVDPMIVRVRPGDSELISITGAKTPTGVPWEPPKERERPSKPYGQGGGRSGGFNRGGPRRTGSGSGGGKSSYSRPRGRD